jgi:hypothetical protein
LAVIKGHSKPFLTVEQIIGITPFQKEIKKKARGHAPGLYDKTRKAGAI